MPQCQRKTAQCRAQRASSCFPGGGGGASSSPLAAEFLFALNGGKSPKGKPAAAHATPASALGGPPAGSTPSLPPPAAPAARPGLLSLRLGGAWTGGERKGWRGARGEEKVSNKDTRRLPPAA